MSLHRKHKLKSHTVAKLDVMEEQAEPHDTCTTDAEDSSQQETYEEADLGFSASCLTTAELQQHWRAVKQEFRSVKVLFDIPSTRIIDKILSKYVVYQIVVIQSGIYDCEHATIERRYSDFLHLHQELLLDFSEEIEDIVMPRKRMTGNFSEDNISERRVALRDYITQLYSIRYVRQSQAFHLFFTRQELKEAYVLLRGGKFSRALESLQKVLVLQEKLSSHNSILVVPTLCAILVCQRDLEDFNSAFQTGRRALPTVRRYELRRYQGPLLEALVDLGYSLGLPVAQLQDELTRVRDCPHGQGSHMSLKELVVQEFV